MPPTTTVPAEAPPVSLGLLKVTVLLLPVGVAFWGGVIYLIFN